MTPEEKSAILQRVKDEYAKKEGYKDFDTLPPRLYPPNTFHPLIHEIAERYAEQLIKALAPSDEEIERNAILFVNKFKMLENQQRMLKIQYIGEMKAFKKLFTKTVGGE